MNNNKFINEKPNHQNELGGPQQLQRPAFLGLQRRAGEASETDHYPPFKVKRVVMGLDKFKRTPWGFCREDAEAEGH